MVNPGFEDPQGFTAYPVTLASGPGGTSGVDQGWALFGAASRSDMSNSVDGPFAGSYSLLVQNTPGNNWNPAGAYQIISGAMPGIVYTFSCSFLTDTGTAYGTPVELAIGFQDANPDDPFLGAGLVGNWQVIPDNHSWYQGSVTATAPPGAVNVAVFVLFMDNGQTSTENVYFDNAAIPTIPEPSGPALVGVGLAVSACRTRRRIC